MRYAIININKAQQAVFDPLIHRCDLDNQRMIVNSKELSRYGDFEDVVQAFEGDAFENASQLKTYINKGGW